MNRLFPPPHLRDEIDASLSEKLSDAHARVIAGSVVPTFDFAHFQTELANFDFTTPRSYRDMFAWTIQQMETGLVHVNHPRYFGLFNPAPTFPAQCADRIAAVFNPQLATATTSPAAVAIENHVLEKVAERLGFSPDAKGHFTTGGAEANYTALILALTRACPEFASYGARGFTGQPTFYVSQDCHLAWLKIAHQAGIGRSAMRLIATDGQGQMDSDKLAEVMQQDRSAGYIPVMIVATAGTTNAGMIDPIEACLDQAHAMGVWLHVDAAWGGAIIASNRHTDILSDIADADSVTVDAHKWFATTMGCGMFITRWPALLTATFHVSTTYMPSESTDDPYVNSVQWSRRFLGLRLFLALAIVGWKGYGDHVNGTLALSEQLKQQVTSKPGWQVVNGSRLGVLCIKPPQQQHVRMIVKHVLASGLAWVSVATFEGAEVIRACVTSGETSKNDIGELVQCLHQQPIPEGDLA